jgi:sugar phosphate isomerase/epimerase
MEKGGLAMITFGVCTSPEQASTFAAAGFTFHEVNVQSNLKPLGDDTAFAPELIRLRGAALPAPAANCLLPGSLKTCGPTVNFPDLLRYATVAMRRAAATGMQTLVFGSGAARMVPDGFPRELAWQQLLEFCRFASREAAPHNVMLVVEPLNRKECNILNTVGECGALVEQVAHPNCMLLVDAYHWGRDNDSAADIVKYGGLLRHAHIATYANRLAPGAEPCDFGPFFKAIAEARYSGRIAVEGKWTDPAKEAPIAMETLRRAATAAGLEVQRG